MAVVWTSGNQLLEGAHGYKLGRYNTDASEYTNGECLRERE